MVFEKQSSKTVGLDAAGPADVHTLYDQCSASEKKLTREIFNELKIHIARVLTFRGPIFDVFSNKNNAAPLQDSQLAARYGLLLAVFREVMCADDRLRI